MIVLMFIKKLLLLTLRLFLLNLLEFKKEINALMQLETGLKKHIDSYSQQSKFNAVFWMVAILWNCRDFEVLEASLAETMFCVAVEMGWRCSTWAQVVRTRCAGGSTLNWQRLVSVATLSSILCGCQVLGVAAVSPGQLSSSWWHSLVLPSSSTYWPEPAAATTCQYLNIVKTHRHRASS